MGLLTKSLGIRAFSLEDPAQPLMPMSALFESLGLGRSDAGVLVNEKQAMRLSPVFACFKVISEDLSKVSLSVFQRMPDDSVRLAREHPVHRLIHDQPNPMMTAATWRGAKITNALAFGAAYSFIQRDKASRPISLHLLPSDKTSAVLVKGRFGFATTATTTGQTEWIDPENILHLLGLSLDGITGYSPTTTCKNAIGIGLAAEKYNAQFFGNGARATGVLTHPEHLDTEAYENLKKSVREWATGENALRPIILEEGLKWEQITVNPNDGQVVQTRKFQVEEVARLYRVPLHKLGELTRSTNNNIEQQAIEHRQDALAPWAVKLEQEINRKLLGGNYFSEHDFSELERGDSATIWSNMQTGRNIGVLDTNDCLRRVRMNPIPKEEGGNVRTVQGAMIPLTALVTTSGEPESSSQGDADSQIADRLRRQLIGSYRRLFRDAVGRIIHRKAEESFAQALLQPVLASMREAINVARLGIPTLDEGDEQKVRELAARLAASAKDWKRENAAVLATDLTQAAYDALR